MGQPNNIAAGAIKGLGKLGLELKRDRGPPEEAPAFSGGRHNAISLNRIVQKHGDHSEYVKGEIPFERRADTAIWKDIKNNRQRLDILSQHRPKERHGRMAKVGQFLYSTSFIVFGTVRKVNQLAEHYLLVEIYSTHYQVSVSVMFEQHKAASFAWDFYDLNSWRPIEVTVLPDTNQYTQLYEIPVKPSVTVGDIP